MYRLPDTNDPVDFPNDFNASPEGLLALGGNLLPKTLVNAYSKGIFPWFNEGDPILWWHPNPRLIIFPECVHISRKMRHLLKKTCLITQNITTELPFGPNTTSKWQYVTTFNRSFEHIIEECQSKRTPQRDGTWITDDIKMSYIELHRQGMAHSVEVWDANGDLVGGMYGVAIGKVFFGESMFSHQDNTSKIALIWLCDFLKQHDFLLLDCQVESDHLLSLGAESISRKAFLAHLKEAECHHKKPASEFPAPLTK